jgi:putative nucleotidyltransferase with HDIG domain
VSVDQELKRAVSIVGDLPSIPKVAKDVMSAVADVSTSADDLRVVLEQDPALASRVLKVANSSLYAFRREVETLRHAIALLGFRTVESLVMAASLRDVFAHFGLSEKLLWEHSTMASVVAGRLASYGAIELERDQAFTAGLLHDLGKIALSNVYRERYHTIILRTYNEGVAFKDAEREEFGFDHSALGAQVAAKWGLPPILVAAIRCHHFHPDDYPAGPPEQRRLIALTSVVTRACTKLGLGRRGAAESIVLDENPAWQELGLGAEDVNPILELVAEEAKGAQGLFS